MKYCRFQEEIRNEYKILVRILHGKRPSIDEGMHTKLLKTFEGRELGIGEEMHRKLENLKGKDLGIGGRITMK
jgi:hypothetical protein